jgi:hypothetical protein
LQTNFFINILLQIFDKYAENGELEYDILEFAIKNVFQELGFADEIIGFTFENIDSNQKYNLERFSDMILEIKKKITVYG